MSYYRVITAIRNFSEHGIEYPHVHLPLEERIRRAIGALELGRTEIERFGMLMMDTIKEIDEAILLVLRDGCYAPAQELAELYKNLELQNQQLLL